MSLFKKVLLVEDDPDTVLLTQRAIKNNGLGIDLHIARDGAEAIGVLIPNSDCPTETKPLLPDVVLLDLNMPRMDGLQVLKKMRADETTRYTPVVMFTSSAEKKDLERAYLAGASGYMTKPSSFSEFKEAVNMLIAFWCCVNKHP